MSFHTYIPTATIISRKVYQALEQKWCQNFSKHRKQTNDCINRQRYCHRRGSKGPIVMILSHCQTQGI